MGICDEPDCLRRADRSGKCWAHVKTAERHGTTEPPKVHLVRLAVRLADCDTDDDEEYVKRETEFLKAAKRYKHARGG